MHGPQSDRPVRSVRRINYPNGAMKSREKLKRPVKSRKNSWPITRCFTKINKVGLIIEHFTKFAWRPTLTCRAIYIYTEILKAHNTVEWTGTFSCTRLWWMDIFYFLHTFSGAINLRERGLFLTGVGGGVQILSSEELSPFRKATFRQHLHNNKISFLWWAMFFSTAKHQARNDFGFVCAMDDGWHAILRPVFLSYQDRTMEGW